MSGPLQTGWRNTSGTHSGCRTQNYRGRMPRFLTLYLHVEKMQWQVFFSHYFLLRYCILGYFSLVIFSPFYTCKQICSILNSSRHVWVYFKMIWHVGIWPVVIRPLTMSAKIKLGSEYFPVYSNYHKTIIHSMWLAQSDNYAV